MNAGFFEQVWALVATLPRARVLTYGQVAALLGAPRGARAVGWALRALPEAKAARTPWHRVVGAGGRLSPRRSGHEREQRRRLRAEGVVFIGARVDLALHAALAAGCGGRALTARARPSPPRSAARR